MWFGCDTPYLMPDISICYNHATTIRDTLARNDQIGMDRQAPMHEERYERQRQEQLKLVKANKPQSDMLIEKVPEHWVYYVKTDDHIKIGYTTDLNGRLRSYPPNAQILGVEYGDRDLERQRHEQFNAYLAYGREWFHDTQEIRDHIATLPPMTHLNIKRMRRGQANQASRVQPRYWTGK